MADTKIEWTEKTWNPIRAMQIGGSKPGHYCALISKGCANCYASAMQPRLFNMPTYPGPGKADYTDNAVDVSVGNGISVYLDQDVLAQPLKWQKPRRVFPCSMTDLFGAWVPDRWIDQIFAVMANAEQHTFQILTKRSERMRDYLGRTAIISNIGQMWFNPSLRVGGNGPAWPLPNVWVGVSVENQEQADKRIPDLLATPAAVRWLSCEPLLGLLNLS